jgi:ADP-ribosylglycohydrolase
MEQLVMRKFSGFLRLIAFGDALGAPYEESDDSVLNRWREGRRRPVPDADALSDEKLVWTDDTAMNLAVGRAMASAGGYSAESAWAEYKKALGDELVHGWGRVVKAAIEQGSGVKDTARNGALMRAPMVLMSCLLGDWNSALERALENIVKDTRLTHNSDLCVAASVSYSRALFTALSAPDYDDKPGSIANVLDEVIVSVDLDLEEMAIDPRARLAVVTTMEDVRRWIRSSPRVVLEEIKSSSYLPSGHVLSTLATSVWLGLYAMMAARRAKNARKNFYREIFLAKKFAADVSHRGGDVRAMPSQPPSHASLSPWRYNCGPRSRPKRSRGDVSGPRRPSGKNSLRVNHDCQRKHIRRTAGSRVAAGRTYCLASGPILRRS